MLTIIQQLCSIKQKQGLWKGLFVHLYNVYNEDQWHITAHLRYESFMLRQQITTKVATKKTEGNCFKESWTSERLMRNMQKNAQTEAEVWTTRLVHKCVRPARFDCQRQYSTAQNTSDNLPSYPKLTGEVSVLTRKNGN